MGEEFTSVFLLLIVAIVIAVRAVMMMMPPTVMVMTIMADIFAGSPRMSAMGHSRPSRASSKSGHVRYAPIATNFRGAAK